NTYMKLQMAAHKQVDMHKQSLRALQQRLSLASPDECLSRGYVRIFKNGEWVKKSPTLNKEDQVEIQFEDGTKTAVIK
ncbi:MAG: exodeoxyribonuclease VII large subunit, partial [Bacteroidales bacterium]|nr:exodeoxyribonuclease VII large subunit [Bacteroidales bacterium]